MNKFIPTLLILLLPTAILADGLKQFTSDGCSAFPDGTLEHHSLWLDCCIQHDLSYWKGGTEDERLAADRQLEQCVLQVGEPEISRVMLAGVRVGGSPHYPTPYRWGYGWPYARGYKALSNEEMTQVKNRLKEFTQLLENFSSNLPLGKHE